MMVTRQAGKSIRSLAGVGCLLGLLGVAGCGDLATGSGSAADAVTSFERALGDGDGDRACSLLTPQVVSALERSEGKPCARAIVSIGLPQSDKQASAETYGMNALVTTGTDVLFLTYSTGQWQVIGAGCRRQPSDQPYSCLVTG